MPPPETTARRASRIKDRFYFQKWNRFERWKWGLSIVLFGAALLAAAAGIFLPRHGTHFYTHGPVAAVHAAWEDRCDACHEPFQPVNGNDWLAERFGRVSDRGSNARCEACHAGPAHHAAARPDQIENCGACHADHRGRETSLVRNLDEHCTVCHKNLTAATTAGKTDYPNIKDFASHPEFVSLQAQSTRTLKFSHALHLTEGMSRSSDARRPWIPANIADPEQRAKYKTGPKGGVQLDCGSCHQLGGGDAGTARPTGAYYPLVTYENACRACHPLHEFDDKLPKLSVPHRLQPEELRTFLRRAYRDEFLTDSGKLLDKPLKPSLRLDARDTEAVATARTAIEKRVTAAEERLYSGANTCGKCHDYDADPGRMTPKAIVPVQVPDLWLPHAKFDHAAHKAVDCRGCHAGAYPEGVDLTKLVEREPVAITGVETCQKCHGPATTVNGEPRGGARADCVECHRYHNGDAPRQGLGAAARGPKGRPMDFESFLRGAAP